MKAYISAGLIAAATVLLGTALVSVESTKTTKEQPVAQITFPKNDKSFPALIYRLIDSWGRDEKIG